MSMSIRRLVVLGGILVFRAATPVLAGCYFSSDGGTFVTLVRNGNSTAYQMSYSSGGEPALNGANLGTFSTADSNTLVLMSFTNKTYEESGSDIMGGRFAYRVQHAGENVPFTTNLNNGWQQISVGWELHYGTNMNINLLSGLTNGAYQLEVYALAQGNFDGFLLQNNNGSNYVATFTVTQEHIPDPVAEVTENGRTILSFAYTIDTGYGNDLFVVGNHPDLGNWDPLQARKLYWTSGNVWTGQIAVEAGYALEYKYIIRTNSAAVFGDAGNVQWMGGANLTTNIPAAPAAPYTGKALYYYSGWTNANLVYQCGLDTNWYGADMTRIGNGRIAGEYLYRVEGIGTAGELLTFVPNGYLDNVQYWDHSPANGGNYYTRLDEFVLQDGNVYNYWPPSSASVSRVIKTNVTAALAPPLNARSVWIYLPRGYDQNTWKKYPVLYMHDGTNVFRPGGIYGTWAAETNADSMISLGMMRETIIVATDTSTNRSREYIPPGDDEGAGPGLADQYAHLLIDYVKPMIESTYRTLTNRADTIVMGSSYGGLVSLYLGLETNVFGKIGALSSAAVVASNFMGRVDSNNTYGARIYLDMGTLDLDASLWESGWQMYNLLLQDGYAVNHDLCYAVGYGQTHNEAAWDQRLPGAYTFLLNILDEPNLLLQSANPPELELLGAAPGAIGVSIDTFKGRRYRLDRTDDILNHPWAGVATSTVEQLLWSETTLTDTSHPSGSTYYYRVSAMSWPE